MYLKGVRFRSTHEDAITKTGVTTRKAASVAQVQAGNEQTYPLYYNNYFYL